MYSDEPCMGLCKGLRDQMDDDAKGLKCLRGLSQKDMEILVTDMDETAGGFVDDNAIETSGSHGDMPPWLMKAGKLWNQIKTQSGKAQAETHQSGQGELGRYQGHESRGQLPWLG